VSKKLRLEIENQLAAGFAQLSIAIQHSSTISDKTPLTLVKYGASDTLVIAFHFKMTISFLEK